MREILRAHVGVASALLSALALAIVFGAVFRVIPAGPLPRFGTLIDLVPHLNAVISLAAIASIGFGVRSIKRGRVARHRVAMVLSTLLFATFLVAYLYKILLTGPTTFAGPAAVKQFVYFPLLGIHMLLAVVAVPLVIYVLMLAGTHSTSELPSTPHPRVGRFAASFWLISFALGLVVYLFLHVIY